MFAKSSRLSRQEIETVTKAGKSLHTSLFSIKTLKNEGKISKFAFVASKKECGGAVDRVKCKRRARAAMRSIGGLSSPVLLIMFIKKPFLKAKPAEILGLMKESLIKQNLLDK